MSGDSISPTFFNEVAQIAHFSATYALTLSLMLFSTVRQKRRWLIVFLLIVAYAAFHEGYWDPHHENPATRGSDVEDFLFLVSGSVVAELVAFWRLSGAKPTLKQDALR